MYSFGYTLLYSATSQHRIHAVIVALFLLIPTAADILRGTILPWSYQAAHRTITSALVVLLCLTDVECQALSHVGSIHAGHMRWTHRAGRCVVYATIKHVMCMSMACHPKIHLQFLLCWWALHTLMICFSITRYLHHPWLCSRFPEAMICKDENPNPHAHSSEWAAGIPLHKSTLTCSVSDRPENPTQQPRNVCLLSGWQFHVVIICIHSITYMYTEILHTEWQRRM